MTNSERSQQVEPRHGVDCRKVEHVGTGHLHYPDHDGPYDVDGVEYCGRCHEWIGTKPRAATTEPVAQRQQFPDAFTVEVELEENGSWLAEVMEVDGAMAYGNQPSHAILNALQVARIENCGIDEAEPVAPEASRALEPAGESQPRPACGATQHILGDGCADCREFAKEQAQGKVEELARQWLWKELGNLNTAIRKWYDEIPGTVENWESVSRGIEESLAKLLRTLQPAPADEGCICEGNWRQIVKEEEPNFNSEYVDERGNRFRFFGLVHASDDYYYGMNGPTGMRLLSCVGSIEGFGLKKSASESVQSEEK